ncbi:uncharacterized protein LOC143028445 isoform X3 [Oratosquilla oratoria]|uniref:uncharacterized protein LOC143028445 isoform X3 n=1 Tax=Oratosquilla oratoria TaxID=337810 RepID=UPI003F769A99
MQAAGMLKERDKGQVEKPNQGVKSGRPMAMPKLVASITQDDSDVVTIIEEAKDGMSWITSQVRLPNGKRAWSNKGLGGEGKRGKGHPGKWNKNKVGDSSKGGGGEGKTADGKFRQTGVVNVVLYVGLGLIALGLIITFVGLGERGFKTVELQLIGPSLIGCGVLFALLRVLFCSLPPCCKCKKNKPLDEKSLLSPSRETLAEEGLRAMSQQQQQQGQQPQQPEQGQERHQEPEGSPQGPRSGGATTKSAKTLHSTIPNSINYDDEVDDDETIGLSTEKPSTSYESDASRPFSAQSRNSPASRVTRLPDIHKGPRTNSELVLNPAKLEDGHG